MLLDVFVIRTNQEWTYITQKSIEQRSIESEIFMIGINCMERIEARLCIILELQKKTLIRNISAVLCQENRVS